MALWDSKNIPKKQFVLSILILIVPHQWRGLNDSQLDCLLKQEWTHKASKVWRCLKPICKWPANLSTYLHQVSSGYTYLLVWLVALIVCMSYISCFFPKVSSPPSMSPPDNLSSFQSGYHNPGINDASYTLHDCQTSKQDCPPKIRNPSCNSTTRLESQRFINISPCAKCIQVYYPTRSPDSNRQHKKELCMTLRTFRSSSLATPNSSRKCYRMLLQHQKYQWHL